jgi:hypothetical protein
VRDLHDALRGQHGEQALLFVEDRIEHDVEGALGRVALHRVIHERAAHGHPLKCVRAHARERQRQAARHSLEPTPLGVKQRGRAHLEREARKPRLLLHVHQRSTQRDEPLVKRGQRGQQRRVQRLLPVEVRMERVREAVHQHLGHALVCALERGRGQLGEQRGQKQRRPLKSEPLEQARAAPRVRQQRLHELADRFEQQRLLSGRLRSFAHERDRMRCCGRHASSMARATRREKPAATFRRGSGRSRKGRCASAQMCALDLEQKRAQPLHRVLAWRGETEELLVEPLDIDLERGGELVLERLKGALIVAPRRRHQTQAQPKASVGHHRDDRAEIEFVELVLFFHVGFVGHRFFSPSPLASATT